MLFIIAAMSTLDGVSVSNNGPEKSFKFAICPVMVNSLHKIARVLVLYCLEVLQDWLKECRI